MCALGRQGRGWLTAWLALAALVLVMGSGPARAQDQPTTTLAAVAPSHTGATLPTPPTAEPPPATPTPAAKAPDRASPHRHAHPTRKRRGGINPCMTPDPGFGIYDHWSHRISMGQLLAPQRGGLTRGGGFDLVVHFHGHYPVRKEFVKTARGQVLVAIDLGTGSGAYSQAFNSPIVFKTLLASIKREMARRSGRSKTYIRKLALSSWSAGYGAVAQILRQPAGKKVDALILLDSLYAGYADPAGHKLKTRPLEPFIAFARQAARGRRLMFQSFSSIQPPGYASTGQVAAYMVHRLGGKLRHSRRHDPLGLAMYSRFDRGGYHVRGYRGEDKPDHCAHLGLVRDVLKVHLNRRWHTPRGHRGKRALAHATAAAAHSGHGYAVRAGDSLSAIAAQHGITVSALRHANDLAEDSAAIRPGQQLILPARTEVGSATATGPALGPGEQRHRVAHGQSLGKIARRYHVRVADIRKRNHLSKGGRKIQPGDELVIPRASHHPAPASSLPSLRAGERRHQVAHGQSLGRIARRYHVAVADIRKRNHLPKGGRKIQPGDSLIIPPAKR